VDLWTLNFLIVDLWTVNVDLWTLWTMNVWTVDLTLWTVDWTLWTVDRWTRNLFNRGPEDSNRGLVDCELVDRGPVDSELFSCGPVDLTARGWTSMILLRDLEGTPECNTGLDLEVSRMGRRGVSFTQPFKIRGRGGQKHREINRYPKDLFGGKPCGTRPLSLKDTSLAERRGTRCEPRTAQW
jgi:hypothetical protein